MPCSSGNSNTMSVVRSALASRAAVAACGALGRLPEHLAARSTPPASRCARPCRGSSRASCGRAPCAAARAATRACVFRSDSQKNLASRSRAVTTRSAFFAITPLVLRLRVDDGEKRFLQLAGVGHHRKVVLVVHERRRQHFLRQREKRRGRRSRRRRRDTRRDRRLRRAARRAPSDGRGR